MALAEYNITRPDGIRYSAKLSAEAKAKLAKRDGWKVAAKAADTKAADTKAADTKAADTK